MRTIVAGSRGITDYERVARAIEAAPWTITEVVSGRARGVDQLGERWAQEHGIPVKLFPADWDTHGRRAGFIRNGQMAQYAQAVIAVWDGSSGGTKDMIAKAIELGLRVFVAKMG
jgi:hypothetical protein